MANIKVVYCACVLICLMISSVDCQVRTRGPRMRIIPRQSQAETLTLPSNATSIREDITDNFTCENKTYGYYADVENECQIFHVCLPVTYADGKNQTFRWSFICPESTVFNQENFVCVREEDMTIKCEDSEEYYNLNENFGNKIDDNDTQDMNNMENSDNPENSGNSIDASPSEEMGNNDSNMMDSGAAPEQPMEAGDTRRKPVGKEGNKRRKNSDRNGRYDF